MGSCMRDEGGPFGRCQEPISSPRELLRSARFVVGPLAAPAERTGAPPREASSCICGSAWGRPISDPVGADPLQIFIEQAIGLRSGLR